MMTRHVGVVGDCVECEDGTMIEETRVGDASTRHVGLRCQDCDAEAELEHDFDDGLDGASLSGIENPRMESVNWITCPRCDGHGEIEDPICDLRRAMNGREHSCPNCYGSGSVPRIVETDGGGEIGVECDVDDCSNRVVGLDDGWELSRGVVCQECIDYHDRHGHWPDEEADICIECRVDEGLVKHQCDESAADAILVEPGSQCDYCAFEAAASQ